MRIVAWNIRAGGGVRVSGIAEQISAWAPDVVALSEFRGTPPSQELARSISDARLPFQRSTADPRQPAVNALLVASRWPMRAVNLRRAPDEPHRWLHLNVLADEPFAIMALHVPNRVTGRKFRFLEAVTEVAYGWRGGPALIVGDTNSGQIDVDEESPAFNRKEDDWIQGMGQRGWPDVFRKRHPETREYTWYSPNQRNGFRLDQAFVNRRLERRLTSVRYEWGRTGADSRRETLSDHAAIVLDFD